MLFPLLGLYHVVDRQGTWSQRHRADGNLSGRYGSFVPDHRDPVDPRPNPLSLLPETGSLKAPCITAADHR